MKRLLHRGALAALLIGMLGIVPLGLATPAGAAPVKDLTLTLTSSAEPESGQSVTFAGSGPSKLRGAGVKLLRRVGKGDWVKVGKSTVADDGSFALSGVATGTGKNSWKAVATKSRVKHVSRSVNTTVFGWYYLSEQEYVDSDGWPYEDSATIGGIVYAKSVMAWGDDYDDPEWLDYNLSYRCKTFESSIGVHDESETGYQAAMSVFLDGAETPLGTKGLGSATAVSLDVTGRLRVRLEVTHVDVEGYPSGAGVFGNAQVLCSGRP